MPDGPLEADTVLGLAEKASLQPLGDGEGGVILRLDTGELYTINDTALSFVSSLDGKRTFKEAARLLADEYDVDLDVLTRDLADIASELLSEALIERVR